MNSKESQVIFKFSTIQTYSYIGVGNHKSNLVHILYSYFSSNAKQPKNLVKRSYIISTHILRDMHYIYILYTHVSDVSSLWNRAFPTWNQCKKWVEQHSFSAFFCHISKTFFLSIIHWAFHLENKITKIL